MDTTKLWNQILKTTDPNKPPISILSRKRMINFITNFLLEKAMQNSAANDTNFDVGFMDDYEQIKQEILQFLKNVCCSYFVQATFLFVCVKNMTRMEPYL